MLTLLALLPMMAQAASTDAEPYPARAVLAAFGTACSGVENLDVAKASALAAGWEEIDPDPESAIGKLVAFGYGSIKEDDEAKLLAGSTYRKDVMSRELHLVISGVALETVSTHGCRLYDLAADSALTEKELSDWAVRNPKPLFSGIPGGVRYGWNPGLKPGHAEMDMTFFPQDAQLPPPVYGLPLSGLILTSTAIEFTDP